jgi:hypothetical protein
MCPTTGRITGRPWVSSPPRVYRVVARQLPPLANSGVAPAIISPAELELECQAAPGSLHYGNAEQSSLIFAIGSFCAYPAVIGEGTPPFTFTIDAASASLPEGISLDESSGELAGTAQYLGVVEVDVRVTNAVGSRDTRVCIASAEAVQAINYGGGTDADDTTEIHLEVGEFFSSGLPMIEGTPPFQVSAANLPPWLSLDTQSGELSGVASLLHAWHGADADTTLRRSDIYVEIHVEVTNVVKGALAHHRIVLVMNGRLRFCAVNLLQGLKMEDVTVFIQQERFGPRTDSGGLPDTPEGRGAGRGGLERLGSLRKSQRVRKGEADWATTVLCS